MKFREVVEKVAFGVIEVAAVVVVGAKVVVGIVVMPSTVATGNVTNVTVEVFAFVK